MPSRVRRRAGALVVVALLGLVLAHVALAGDPAGLSPRGPDSPQATRIEDIYWLLIAITGGIFVLVEGALILFVFRFRNRGRSRTLEGPEIHGATRLELIWTAIPVVILAAIVAFVLVKLPGINSADSAKAAGPPLIVKVEAREQASGTADRGKMTFDGACATCHGFHAQGAFGPNLRGNPILQQPAAIKTLLQNGRNKMPAVGKGWSSRQMNALLAYVKRFAG